MPTEKGKFSAEISQSVIDEALNSVRQRTNLDPAASAAPAEAAASNDEGVSLDAGETAVPDEPEPAAASASNKELADLKLQLELSQAKGRELMDKLREEHERTLRATADLENYRKRALKEKEEVQRFGVEKLLKDFLPVLDNLDRALEHSANAKAADPAGLQKGVEMTRKMFEDALGKQGMKSFSAMGKLFDPRLHEAMSQVETADSPPNTVVYEMVRGYTLHDRLVRPALVSVAKAPAAAAAAVASPVASAPATESASESSAAEQPAAADAPAANDASEAKPQP